jgi:hypothetical protein
VRELPEEKLLIVFNNAAKARSLEIPVSDTPLENAHRLELLFGGGSDSIAANSAEKNAGRSPAEVDHGQVRVSLPAQSMAVFSVK